MFFVIGYHWFSSNSGKQVHHCTILLRFNCIDLVGPCWLLASYLQVMSPNTSWIPRLLMPFWSVWCFFLTLVPVPTAQQVNILSIRHLWEDKASSIITFGKPPGWQELTHLNRQAQTSLCTCTVKDCREIIEGGKPRKETKRW